MSTIQVNVGYLTINKLLKSSMIYVFFLRNVADLFNKQKDKSDRFLQGHFIK